MTSQRSITCLTLLALLMQAMVWLMPWGQAHAAEEVAHRFVHAQAITHGHELDASLLVDAGSESAFHLHAQDAGQPLALVAPRLKTALCRADAVLSPVLSAQLSSVYLEGLLRPPSLHF